MWLLAIIGLATTLFAAAVAMLAWLAPAEKINYEIRFYLILCAFGLIVVAIALLIWAFWIYRKKMEAIDGLSEEISWAIHHIVNMPKPTQETWDEYAVRFNEAHDAWCPQVERTLGNKRFFTQSDLLHFQHLGIIQQFNLTGHPATDHAFSMMNLRLARLREIIARNI